MNGTGLQGVTVRRGGVTVLRDVTLSAADGELLVVLGPSGSGKSTLLRVMAGLTEVSSGEVVIRGRQVTRLPPQQRGVAMVYESTSLAPFLDVAQNMGRGLRTQSVPADEIRHRVFARARDLRLTRLLSRRPQSLSAGETGLVGIGRALVRAPDVFLLDEPLAHLDAAQRLRVRRRIVEVVRSLGVTTLYVTHDQAEALAVGDRVAMLDDGRVVQVDVPIGLYRRPANLFVAGFVGGPPIGLLPARLVVSGGSASSAGSARSAGLAGFRVGMRTLPLWAPVPDELSGHVGRDVVLGLRAEDVHDLRRGYDPELASLAATVTAVEYTGRDNVVTLAVDAPPVDAPGAPAPADLFAQAQLRSRFPPRAEVRAGETVQIAVDVARAHVFDAGTGQALWHPPD